MIIAAAIKINAPDVGEVIIAGRQYNDCYSALEKLNAVLYSGVMRREIQCVKGFICNTFSGFLTKEEAYYEASVCGQLSTKVKMEKKKAKDNFLEPEDLY